jgi:hypothetical protein
MSLAVIKKRAAGGARRNPPRSIEVRGAVVGYRFAPLNPRLAEPSAQLKRDLPAFLHATQERFTMIKHLFVAALLSAALPAQPTHARDKPAAPRTAMSYQGSAEFSQTRSFEVSFSLSADKSEISDLELVIKGMDVTGHHGNMQIRQRVEQLRTKYGSSFPVKKNKADIPLGTRNGQLLIEFGNPGPTGTIAYTYIIQGASSGPHTHPDIPIQFGMSRIKFHPQ